MTIQIKHPFVSAKGDGTDATLVRPSNWNAVHTTSMATLSLLGRLTAGTGSFEELPTSAFIIAALAATDAASFFAALSAGAFTTGDVKLTYKASADTGWIIPGNGGTIGDATSGASVRANADTASLFSLLWATVPALAVSGGRGANAAADFAAHKTLTLPGIPSRTIGVSGAGDAGTKVLGSTEGALTQTLGTTHLPSHTHAGTTGNDSPDHSHTYTLPTQIGAGTSGGGLAYSSATTASTGGANTRHTHPFTTDGGPGASTPFSLYQPTTYMNVMIKL